MIHFLTGITDSEQGVAFMKSIQKNPIVYATVRRLEAEEAYTAQICN